MGAARRADAANALQPNPSATHRKEREPGGGAEDGKGRGGREAERLRDEEERKTSEERRRIEEAERANEEVRRRESEEQRKGRVEERVNVDIDISVNPSSAEGGGGWRAAGAALAAALAMCWAMSASGAVHALTGETEPGPSVDEQYEADGGEGEGWSENGGGSCSGDGAASWSTLGAATAALPVIQLLLGAARMLRKAG